MEPKSLSRWPVLGSFPTTQFLVMLWGVAFICTVVAACVRWEAIPGGLVELLLGGFVVEAGRYGAKRFSDAGYAATRRTNGTNGKLEQEKQECKTPSPQ